MKIFSLHFVAAAVVVVVVLVLVSAWRNVCNFRTWHVDCIRIYNCKCVCLYVCILGNSHRNVFIHHQHHSNSRCDVTAHCAGCWPHCAAHTDTQQQNPTPAGFLQTTSKNNNRNVSWQSANSRLSRCSSAPTSQQAARNETKQVFLLPLRIRHKAATHAAEAESQRAAAARKRERERGRANVQNAVARAGFSLLLYFLFLPFRFLQACNDDDDVDDAALLCMYTRHDTRARTPLHTHAHTHTHTHARKQI